MIMKTKHVKNTGQMVRRGQTGQIVKGGQKVAQGGIAPFAP